MSDVPKDSEDFDAERATEKLAGLIQDATGGSAGGFDPAAGCRRFRDQSELLDERTRG